MFGCAATDQCVTDQSFCATCADAAAASKQKGENGQQSLASHSHSDRQLINAATPIKRTRMTGGQRLFYPCFFFLYSSRGSHFHKIISRHVYMTLRREALGNYYSVWLNDSSAPYHLIGRHLAASSLNEQLVLID